MVPENRTLICRLCCDSATMNWSSYSLLVVQVFQLSPSRFLGIHRLNILEQVKKNLSIFKKYLVFLLAGANSSSSDSWSRCRFCLWRASRFRPTCFRLSFSLRGWSSLLRSSSRTCRFQDSSDCASARGIASRSGLKLGYFLRSVASHWKKMKLLGIINKNNG